ncbi:hypothetical protein E2C01_059242 [Portunus trituberculatus]|uniref:Uncharacterized protein n=1 Tax=Portunus trituberculatus TaxID=210409 RepID=A0A5B7H8J4_PORTR|nr:hypothetical protein [Portunus trituberculatus]
MKRPHNHFSVNWTSYKIRPFVLHWEHLSPSQSVPFRQRLPSPPCHTDAPYLSGPIPNLPPPLGVMPSTPSSCGKTGSYFMAPCHIKPTHPL